MRVGLENNDSVERNRSQDDKHLSCVRILHINTNVRCFASKLEFFHLSSAGHCRKSIIGISLDIFSLLAAKSKLVQARF